MVRGSGGRPNPLTISPVSASTHVRIPQLNASALAKCTQAAVRNTIVYTV